MEGSREELHFNLCCKTNNEECNLLVWRMAICTSRIFTKKKGVGCDVCVGVLFMLHKTWNLLRACSQCRNYYIPAYECRWINCHMPYSQSVDCHRVYKSSEVLSESTPFSYPEQEPCNFRTNSDINFCNLCEKKIKMFSVLFLSKKIGSFHDAERHIQNKHADLKHVEPAKFSCVICANKKNGKVWKRLASGKVVQF